MALVSGRELLDIPTKTKCRFTLKRVRDMIRTYKQMHRPEKYPQLSSIVSSVWPNGWVVVYKLSGCKLKSCCSHLNFRYRDYFEQGVPWHSRKYSLDSLWNAYVASYEHTVKCTVQTSTYNSAQSFGQFR